jgi:hypothetical protein
VAVGGCDVEIGGRMVSVGYGWGVLVGGVVGVTSWVGKWVGVAMPAC